MILAYLLIALLFFCMGWLFSRRKKVDSVCAKRRKGDFAAEESLRREYENFLKYDGSEQS